MKSWIENAVFYHIYPLGFCGAPQKQSEEQEVSYRLDKLYDWTEDLLSLGINALYLGPVFSSSTHGYDTQDYYQIDRRLGDVSSFKKLCDHLHQKGIRLVLDGVFHHVGRDFWAFQDILQKGEQSPYCDWFANLHFGNQSPMGDPFSYESWEGHFELVKLNLKNPAVLEHIFGAIAMWMDEFQIDGLRLDAANCIDFDFFRKLRAFTKEKNPDFWLMGEVIHGDYNRWANPDMLDSVTNYECYKGLYSSHNDKNYFEIAHSFQRQFGNGGIYRQIRTYNFVDNHDVHRLASILINENHIFNVYTLLFTMPGIPSLYYGSEWGLTGKKENGSDLPVRPCLEREQIQKEQPIYQHIMKLASIYHKQAPLRLGDYTQVSITNEQFLFQRRFAEETVWIGCNLSDQPAQLCIPNAPGELNDLLHTEKVLSASFEVSPYSARILTV